MHKVQEVFSKIGNKLQPAVALSEQLQIPAIESIGTNTPDAQLPSDPDSITSWILANNAFNSHAPADALLRTLKRCNRADLVPQQRQKILQQFEKPCVQALQWLDARYLYRDFPLQPDEHTAFKLASTLCQEMAIGYKRTLHDTIATQQSGYRKPKNLNHDISQTFKHLSRIALRHSMLYRQWPATFWQDANTLVTLAQTTSTGRSSTLPGIIHQYTHLCAFFILANNKHHATDLQGLFGVLSEQPLALKFERKPTGTRLDHYCVGAANPPTPVCFTQSINTDNLQYFCVGPLYQQLQSLQPGSHSAADNMIRYRPTRHGSKRATARATRNNPLKAVVGVMEIHKNINSMPQTENINSQFTNPLELVTTDRLQQKSQYSLFNQIHVNSDSTEFIVENQSRSGFGMRLGNNRNSVNNKVQVGELFAHCYGDTSEEINWHLGSIRWLKTDSDETLRFGVETISKHTSAVEVFRFPHNTKRSTATCKGLLASYQPMDCEVTQLLLPAHTCKPGEIVSFKDRRRNRTVKLVEIVSVNNLYQSFAIKTVDARAKDHGSITTKPSNILKLPLAAAPLVLSR